MNNLAYQDDDILKERIELIDGKVFMMSPCLKYEHITICGNIFRKFGNYLEGKTCQAFPDGFDVFLDEQNKFIPDCMIVCNRDIIKRNGIHGAPDLVVEVLSPSTAKNDRSKKKFAYERAGVKEYWIVNPIDKSVEVYLNQDKTFILDNIYYYYTDEEIAENEQLPPKDKITMYSEIKVSICDNLVVKLKDIFERVDNI